MLAVIAAIATLWAAVTGVPDFVAQRDCLAEAVLAESILAKEPEAGDRMVAFDIYQRWLDGRWGKTLCQTVAMKYPVARVRVERIRIRVKLKHKRVKFLTHLISHHYTGWVCDFSYRCLPQYHNIVAKVPSALYARAQRVADEQMLGEYTPPPGFETALYYQNPHYTEQGGSKWFDCTTKELGRVDPASAHVHYRDATEEELDETLVAHPDCKKFIAAFREANARKVENRSNAAALLSKVLEFKSIASELVAIRRELDNLPKRVENVS